ncbi:transcription factor Opi1-domain-containing protein [Thamnocephalis sphaerospora]|uniref:Transcription factor Opi1-domain-containing protein n=1 Tax=Thamnocephalis sphaerospora TaxID=78915 RepID=A0A4P9XSG8_9FUNG|nr:transcription factor Opi1-domain-containing protein [Thamnocephalis sphaerospora]|eukprot:RKP09065.1 transcription factor Opi1-domain-containing protein [Thamnocephalis sphaerospora]
MGVDAAVSDPQVASNDGFVTRVANIPLVRSTILLYDKSKANSRVVKYGAEMVESSVKTISQPVLNRLEPQLGQLDEFACRQLDKVRPDTNPGVDGLRRRNTVGQMDQGRRRLHATCAALTRLTLTASMVGTDAGQEANGAQQMAVTQSGSNSTSMVTTEQTPQRSRWQKILVGAGTAAGAGAAALSEEGMRSLKYCLEWLSYAVRHIEHQIYLLRSFIASITDHLSGGGAQSGMSPHGASNAVTQADVSTLAAIRREVVETLRKVVEVIGCYAGACLPREARGTVRKFILSLPGRWALLSADLSTVSSVASSPCQSPLLTPTTPPSLMLPGTGGQHRMTPVDSANRVLALATESLLMLKSVADVFGETKDRAETLVDHLRSMGYSPAGGNEANGFVDAYGRPVQVPADLLASRLQAVAQENGSVEPNGYFVPQPHQAAYAQQPSPTSLHQDDAMEL